MRSARRLCQVFIAQAGIVALYLRRPPGNLPPWALALVAAGLALVATYHGLRWWRMRRSETAPDR